jgi:hypothetical protein
MQYDMQKLGRMTLEQLTEIAQTFDIKVGRNADTQSVIYQILDAQADKHGAEVQARADAREERRKGKRARIQNSPQKVNTDNLKGNRVLATVGSKEETLGQIKEEQAKQPQPKPVVSALQPGLFDESIIGNQETQKEEAVVTVAETVGAGEEELGVFALVFELLVVFNKSLRIQPTLPLFVITTYQLDIYPIIVTLVFLSKVILFANSVPGPPRKTMFPVVVPCFLVIMVYVFAPLGALELVFM